MKLILAVIISACCATQVYADDDCENAVDAADSMNVNQQDCDYTDKGLNGVLHKAFKQGSEGAVLETGAENNAEIKKAVAGSATGAVNKTESAIQSFSLSIEVEQWSGVTLARAQLLPKAMEKCVKGFSIERENYRPLPMGRIALSIEGSCFE